MIYKHGQYNQTHRDIIKRAIIQKKSIKIKYKKYTGEETQRLLSDISYTNEFDNATNPEDYTLAFCHLRQEQRTFKINRIISIKQT